MARLKESYVPKRRVGPKVGLLAKKAVASESDRPAVSDEDSEDDGSVPDHEPRNSYGSNDEDIDMRGPPSVEESDNNSDIVQDQDDVDTMVLVPEEPVPVVWLDDTHDIGIVEVPDHGVTKGEGNSSTRISEFLDHTAKFRSTLTDSAVPIPNSGLQEMRARFQTAMQRPHTTNSTNKGHDTDASVQHQKPHNHGQTVGPFGWRTLARMKRTGVHPFNLPIADLYEQAQLNAAHNDASGTPPTHHEPQTASELRALLISAHVESNSPPEGFDLAAAELDLTAAKVSFRNAEVAERMSALRVAAARAQHKLTKDVDELQAVAKEAAVSVEKAKNAVNEAREKVKEAQEAKEEVEMAGHVKLIEDIDRKIAEYEDKEKKE